MLGPSWKSPEGRKTVFGLPYLDAASGSNPLFLITSDERGEERNSINRLPACISFEPATTAAEKV